jgi:hypothetical protein
MGKLPGRNRPPRPPQLHTQLGSIPLSLSSAMASSNFPYTFTTVPDTLKSPFKEHFPAYTEGLVQSNPGNFVYHPIYGANAKKFYDFPIRKDDIWIRTFPRSGKEFDNSICKNLTCI